MKTKLYLILAFILFGASLSKLQAQDAQFVGTEINYELFDDATYKSFASSTGFFEFPCTILWDYAGKTVQIFELSTSQVWLKTSYKTEVNPDKIKGDENFRFEFDPAKNDLKIKVIKIYMQQDGTYIYKIEADKQKIEIKGIEPDLDYDAMGDYSQAQNNTQNYSQGGQNVRYLYFTNTTSYTIKVITKTLPNAYGEWVGSTEFISIAPGKKVKIGESAEEYFYYYASCIDSNSNVIKWDGSDATLEVPGLSTYNLRKINLSVGTQDDQNNWNVDLTLK